VTHATHETQPLRTTTPPTKHPTGKVIALTALVTLGLVAASVFALLKGERSRGWLAERLPRKEHHRPGYAFDLREVLLTEQARAVRAGDAPAAARVNAQLAQEALIRARGVHDAWLRRREPQTKLYAQGADRPTEWNFRNAAADFFSFHLHAGLLLNPDGMDSLKETLEAEAKLRTPEGLCIPVVAATGKPIDVDHDELLFGSSEYAKDGLLSLYERHGRQLIGQRMLAIVDAIIAQSKHASRFGPLPGTGAEINGNLLQLCGRLSYAEQRPDYADFAARIADAMVQQAMAANHGLPPKFYDYSSDKVIDPTLKLKDHGNEAVLGLAEAYAMAVDRRADPAWDKRAQTWEPALARMFDLILAHGVNEQGLLVGTMHPSPPRPDAEKLCDNWGYVLSGAILFTDAARRYGKLDAQRIAAIDAAVERVARAVFDKPIGLTWGGGMDSEADAVESALYVAAYRPALREQALGWADRQITLLYKDQDPDGTAVGMYLDGNFIRTSLLYADARTGGWRVDPWRSDVLVGFATDANGSGALTVWCDQPYAGTLRPPQPRHRTIMKLPWDWARLNSWPEWDVPTADTATITAASGVALTPGPASLPEAIPLTLPANGAVSIAFRRSRPTTDAPR
jgi:hypothetical protein